MHNDQIGSLLRRAAAVAILSSSLALAACGGGGGSAAAAPPGTGVNPNPPTVPTPEPPVAGQTATLEWLPPETKTDGSPVTDLAGYRIYYGPDVEHMTETIDVMNPGVVTYVVEGLQPGTYYFAVTAIDSTSGESERSNAGQKTIG